MFSQVKLKAITLIWSLLFAISLFGQTSGAVKAVRRLLVREAAVVERIAVTAERLAARIYTAPGVRAYKGSFAFLVMEESQVKIAIREGTSIDAGVFKASALSSITDDALTHCNWYIEPDVYFSAEFQPLRKRLNEVTVFYDDLFYKIETQSDFLHVTPSFYYKLENAKELKSLLNFRTWPVHKKEFKFAGIFSERYDLDTYTSLKTLAEKESIPFKMLTRNNLEQVFRESKDRTLFITGHFDGENFFARDARSQMIAEQSFSFQELEDLSGKYNVYNIYLGCETGSRTVASGFLNNIYDHDLIQRLQEALNQRSYVQFLSRLGDIDNPIVLKKFRFEKDRAVMEFELPVIKAPAGTRVTLRVATGYQPVDAIPRGLEAFLLKTVNFWYVVAAFVLAFIVGALTREDSFWINAAAVMFLLSLLYWIAGKLILYMAY